ncbi:type IV pilus modification protein PilV [Thiothrix lacustris]|uniref:type IV pilus modification protein PilV n=1 Tax=Thiothrix lacustris TaxID=525917 RepID=UPI0027E4FD8E|nr:type IV pilus modification protein PilV [Thiothrix lacustris]WMP16979.1 type IV pilus modification protein PilV [Thiothrix lacustris]
MPLRLPLSHKQTGLSLLEVLIATVVLSTGLLGLAGLQIAGMKTTHNSYQMQQATWLVHDLLEHMRANRSAALAGQYNVATSCSEPSPACDTGSCTAANLARYDLFRIRCGTDVSISNTLINGVLTVACFDPPPAGSPVVDLPADCNKGLAVNLQWDERNATHQADFDGGTDGVETFNINLNAIL